MRLVCGRNWSSGRRIEENGRVGFTSLRVKSDTVKQDDIPEHRKHTCIKKKLMLLFSRKKLFIPIFQCLAYIFSGKNWAAFAAGGDGAHKSRIFFSSPPSPPGSSTWGKRRGGPVWHSRRYFLLFLFFFLISHQVLQSKQIAKCVKFWLHDFFSLFSFKLTGEMNKYAKGRFEVVRTTSESWGSTTTGTSTVWNAS